MSTESTSPAHQNRGEPESFRAKALMASLTVKDLAASLAWYTDVVGFTLDQKHERDGKLIGASLKAGDARILINQEDGAKGWDRVKGQGVRLTFITAQSLDDLANRITRCGGTLQSEPADMPWGARMFTLLDPDGFAFAFMSEPKG